MSADEVCFGCGRALHEFVGNEGVAPRLGSTVHGSRNVHGSNKFCLGCGIEVVEFAGNEEVASRVASTVDMSVDEVCFGCGTELHEFVGNEGVAPRLGSPVDMSTNAHGSTFGSDTDTDEESQPQSAAPATFEASCPMPSKTLLQQVFWIC